MPRLKLRPIPDLRWAVDATSGSFKETAEEDSQDAPVMWALTSTKKKGPGTFAATQVSQVERRSKAAVGLVLGVQLDHDNSILVECLLREAAWKADEDEEGEEDGSHDEGDGVQFRQGRERTPSSRAAAAAEAAREARRCRASQQEGMRVCLLDPASPPPLPAEGVEISMGIITEVNPRRCVLRLQSDDMCVSLCTHLVMRKAMETDAADRPGSPQAAALGIAMALHLAHRRHDGRPRGGCVSCALLLVSVSK